ncbi:type II toxin-antitoxin system PemK/MazF family toxin [Pedobacter sp.]|uniref:type II toxin-antitoxin system PemK/MazF family toxin n=1 Tax=Pedobacter sp. TaxID=1411316 RepID=UPI003BAB4EF5
MKFKRGQVLDCLWAKKRNSNGTVTLEARPTIVLRDTMDKPDLVSLIYCTTQNKELTYSNHILIKEGTDEFILMGLDQDTYIVPQYFENVEVELITRKRGHCPENIMKQIEKVLEDWTLGK